MSAIPGERAERVGRALPATATVVAFFLVFAPILIVLVTAFSPTEYFVFPPPGLSLRWFEEFFRLDNMRAAFVLSLQVALVSASVAALLGTLAALALARRGGWVAGLLQGLFLAPLVFPTIILGLALLLFYRSVGMPALPGLMLAHAVIGAPYCFRSVYGGLQSLDPALEEAGASLGAGPLRSFFLVTLPLVWPTMLAGWLFAFIVSFGELNTAIFLTGPGTTTLPIEIFSYLQFQGSQLVIAAASALQVAMIVVMVAAIERVVGIGRIVRSR